VTASNELVIGVGLVQRNTRFHAGVFRMGKRLCECRPLGHADHGQAWQCGLDQAARIQAREIAEGKPAPRIVLGEAMLAWIKIPAGAIVECGGTVLGEKGAAK
jgi:hypothetical protein